MDGHENRIDPAKWQPLIMNFQKLYGVSSGEIVPSRLAEIEEKCYRMPDVDRARDGVLESAGSRNTSRDGFDPNKDLRLG